MKTNTPKNYSNVSNKKWKFLIQGSRLYTIAQMEALKKAIRKGDTEAVRELAIDLMDDGVDLGPALALAKNLNRAKRGQWKDVVDTIEEIMYDDSDDDY